MPKSPTAPRGHLSFATPIGGVLGFSGCGCDVHAIICNFHDEQRDHQYSDFGETYIKVILYYIFESLTHDIFAVSASRRRMDD